MQGPPRHGSVILDWSKESERHRFRRWRMAAPASGCCEDAYPPWQPASVCEGKSRGAGERQLPWEKGPDEMQGERCGGVQAVMSKPSRKCAVAGRRDGP